MLVLSLAVQAGLLWFFISYFGGETDPQAGFRKAAIVIAISAIANLLLAFLVKPFIGIGILPIEIAVVYLLVASILRGIATGLLIR